MSDSSSSSFTNIAQTIFSYNSNILLIALISLLFVLLFVLLLHAYANCFFQRRRRTSVTVSYFLSPYSRRLSGHFDEMGFRFSTKGLDPSAISSIPLFVYESKNNDMGLTECCSICLSEFEDGEIGRCLEKCKHCFHLECVDMWLNSHTNCPICRAPVVVSGENAVEHTAVEGGGGENGVEIVIEEGNCENGQSNIVVDDSSSSSFGIISLKRILSRNRLEGRIFPSSNDSESNS